MSERGEHAAELAREPYRYDVQCERCGSSPIEPTELVGTWTWTGESWSHRCPKRPAASPPLLFDDREGEETGAL